VTFENRRARIFFGQNTLIAKMVSYGGEFFITRKGGVFEN
jgi:hypothetical protein